MWGRVKFWKQGALQFVELMSNTLNALRLTPEQIEQLNRYNMSSYPVRYNTLTRNPEGCEIAITTGQFYANLDLTEFLTSMMNSLLNPYYITDNLNNRYEGNVAYNRAHTTLFESAKLLSNDQLANEDLGLIAYKNHTITLPLDTLAKITNFELAKYDEKMYNSRIVIPNAAITGCTEERGNDPNTWELKNEYAVLGRIWKRCDYQRTVTREGRELSRTHWVFTTVELSDETLHHQKKIQVSVPIAYEILQPYYQKRFKDTNVKVSLKS